MILIVKVIHDYMTSWDLGSPIPRFVIIPGLWSLFPPLCNPLMPDIPRYDPVFNSTQITEREETNSHLNWSFSSSKWNPRLIPRTVTWVPIEAYCCQMSPNPSFPVCKSHGIAIYVLVDTLPPSLMQKPLCQALMLPWRVLCNLRYKTWQHEEMFRSYILVGVQNY